MQGGTAWAAKLVVSTDVHSCLITRPGFLAEISRRRREGYHILDAGDFFEGTAEFNLLGGAPERKALAELYDAVAPGNHGFDIYEQMARAGTGRPAVVQSNLTGWPGPDHWLVPGAMVVGVIGRQAFSTCPALAQRRYRFIEPATALTELDGRARAVGTRLVVLSHQGFEEDRRLAVDLVARGVVPLAIFSGHCHSSNVAANVAGVPVVKGGEHGRGYARLHVGTAETFVDRIDPATLVSRPAHPCIESDAAAFGAAVSAAGHRRIAADVVTAANRVALATLLCQWMTARWGTPALINRGAIRCGISEEYPWCSLPTFHAAVPFNNGLARLRLRGTVEQSARILRSRNGEVTYLAGDADAREAVTTDYLALRLDDADQVEVAYPMAERLQDVAGRCYLVGGAFT